MLEQSSKENTKEVNEVLCELCYNTSEVAVLIHPDYDLQGLKDMSFVLDEVSSGRDTKEQRYMICLASRIKIWNEVFIRTIEDVVYPIKWEDELI